MLSVSERAVFVSGSTLCPFVLPRAGYRILEHFWNDADRGTTELKPEFNLNHI
jgi:hypothetical protein